MAPLLLALAASCTAPPADPPADPLAPALEIIEKAVADGDVPGASVLVMRNGQTLAERVYGVADPQTKQPFQPDTIGWIASLTKPVSAAAAMTLVDQGLLSLDDPVEKHLPAFEGQVGPDGKHSPVLVRQLMSHSSGIQSSVPLRPRFFFEQGWYRRSLEEVAAAIAQTRLTFEPGRKTEYSNAAPYVLGRIVEKQAKQPFGDYVRERILAPLGMTDTGFAIPASKMERTATVYRKQDGESVVFCRFDPAWEVTMTMPDGGLFSTPGDIAKFAQSFLAGESTILSQASVDAMLSRESDGYGLGWILDQPGQFSHWGSSGTMVWADRETGVVGVVFFQFQDYRTVDAIHKQFRQAVTAALAVEQ